MKRLFTFIIMLLLIISTAHSQKESRLLRFPAIHGDQIVFTYAGDLYTVHKAGGIARKLTNGVGYEMFARFSPDGKNIAFTGQYDGNTEVFLIPAQGGVPERLTYTATLNRDDISDRMGPNNIVMCWRDNNTVVYRSRKQTFNSFKGQLFLADIKGGLSEELPLPCGGFCSYSPDKNKLAYNQVFREFRTWKYYRGGMADDVWIYDFATKQVKNITNNPAQDIIPMWNKDIIYFLSDRDRIMNLFSYNTVTEETKKLTNFEKYDIKFPSLGKDAIVFENGGYLYIYNLTTQSAEKITVSIANDFASGRNSTKDASKYIRSLAVSPHGKRVVFGARGDVFTVPVKSGITQNLTTSPGVHDRNVEWSPNGKYISYISDKSGEDEIYIITQDGSEAPVQLTKNSDTYKYNPIWSPDSKKLLWGDKKLRLQYVDIESKKVTVVKQSKVWEYRDYNWSPDSKWITYTNIRNGTTNQVFIYELASKTNTAVTNDWYDANSPVFSTDGKYLFFVSSRDYNPVYSWTEWNHAYVDMNNIYFITLDKSTPSPFEPENDEVKIEEKEDDAGKKDKGDKGEEAEKSDDIKVDLDGISDRIIGLPIKPGRYWNINAIGNSIYFNRFKSSDSKPAFMLYDLKSEKETKLGDYSNYIITADHKKMLLSTGGKYAVIDLPKAKVQLKDFIDLSNMKVWVNLSEEWKQIYDESWRQMRDFFYDPNMHGVDWENIHEKYSPLVPFVNNRNDLNYVIGEMIGELNVGHSYVSGGDRPKPKRIKTGLLGAKLSKDESGYYQINTILKGENWTKNKRSPLTEIGVNVNEGEYILAVNGKSTKEMNDIYVSLVNTAGKQVELTVSNTPSKEDSRKVIVVPIDDESKLYYYNWVQNNINKVSEATDGQVGYIHIPDMGREGLNEFVKYFYPQLRKKALIIDDRGNGGGNVSAMIIERLNREMALMRVSRNTEQAPGRLAMMLGPKVVLIDQYSASDGDLFPYQFKTLKMGKLIGTRTWGGVVGIRGSLPFIDGGSLQKPEFAHYDAEGKKFIIEGHGVEPDIVVVNDPAKEYAGEDQQLNKAIEVILEEMKNYPQELPPVPDYPDKSKTPEDK